MHKSPRTHATYGKSELTGGGYNIFMKVLLHSMQNILSAIERLTRRKRQLENSAVHGTCKIINDGSQGETVC